MARGRGALDVALGDGLAALQVGDRTLRLGYSGVGDYARDRLGIAGRTAQNMARLTRELRARSPSANALTWELGLGPDGTPLEVHGPTRH